MLYFLFILLIVFFLLLLFFIIHSFYIVLFSALEQTHCAHWHVILNEWLYLFIARIINIHGSGVLLTLFGCCMADATRNCCRLGASFVYTIQPCPSLQCHFIQSHVGMVYACFAVTCHLHFWQNGWDLLCATVVTWGGMDTEIGVNTENLPWRRRSATPAGTWTRDLLIPSPVRYHWAIHAHLFTLKYQHTFHP